METCCESLDGEGGGMRRKVAITGLMLLCLTHEALVSRANGEDITQQQVASPNKQDPLLLARSEVQIMERSVTGYRMMIASLENTLANPSISDEDRDAKSQQLDFYIKSLHGAEDALIDAKDKLRLRQEQLSKRR